MTNTQKYIAPMISIDQINAAVKAGLQASEILRDWSKRKLNVEFKSDESPVTLADRDAHRIIWDILEKTNIPILSEEGKVIPVAERQSWKKFWLVDPLDGTKEFIKGSPEYTVNIALIDDGLPVFGLIAVPEQKLVYIGFSDTGSRRFTEDDLFKGYSDLEGITLPDYPSSEEYRVVASRSHLSPETAEYIENLKSSQQNIEFVQAGSALKFCRLAEGAADIYPRFTPCMEWDTGAGHAILLGVGKDILKVSDGLPLEYNKEDLLSPFFIAQ